MLIVNRLRQTMTEAQSAGVAPETRDMILEKLGDILEGEKALSKLSLQQRSSLHEKISSLRRGKKAISGYSQTLAPSPQFVSHNR